MAEAYASTELIVLAYLKGQGFYKALMALEDESSMCSDAYDSEMMFLRWLMCGVPHLPASPFLSALTQNGRYEGHWTDAEACLLPYENHTKISYSDLLFTVRRQRFLEIVEDPKLRPSLADLVVILKGMECLCPPPVFQSLCYLLTLQKVTDSPQFSSWSIHKGRYDAFHACLTLLQPAFNRPLFKPSSIPLPAPEFLSQSLTAAGIRLKPASSKQPARSLHHSIDNLKSPLLIEPSHAHHGSNSSKPNMPASLQTHETSPLRSSFGAQASVSQAGNTHTLILPVPLSPSRSVVRDADGLAEPAQNTPPRLQQELLQQPLSYRSPSHASPHHDTQPFLPPISVDDDEHTSSSPSAFSGAAAAVSVADDAAAAPHSPHNEPSSPSSSRSPSPHDSPHNNTSPPPRAQASACRPMPSPARANFTMFRFAASTSPDTVPQAWTVEFTAPAPGARPPKALTQRLAAAQQKVSHKVDDARKIASSSSSSSKPSSLAPLRPDSARARTSSSPSRPAAVHTGNSGGQPANRPLSATRLRLEARAAGLADRVESAGKQAGAISGAAASSARHPPPHSVRFADNDRLGASAGIPSSPSRGLAAVGTVAGTPDRLAKLRSKYSGAFAGYDDFVPDALQEVSSVSDAQVIRCISWSPAPGGPYFALGTTGHALRLCGVDSSSRICVLKSVEELHSGSVYCIAWSSNGSVVATGSNDKMLKIVSIAERDRKITDVGTPVSLSGHTGTVRAATFCETFRSGCLVSGGAGDNIVRMWDTETQACVGRLPALSDHVQALTTFTHDPALLISGCKDGSTSGWDLRTLKKVFEVAHPHAPNDVTCVSAHPSRPAAAVGYGNGDVALFDVRGQGSLLHSMPLHTDQCRSVEFSPNGAYVATAAFDCNVIIAEAATLAPTKQLHAHRDKVVQAHWHPALPLLLTCSVDKSLKLWSQPML